MMDVPLTNRVKLTRQNNGIKNDSCPKYLDNKPYIWHGAFL